MALSRPIYNLLGLYFEQLFNHPLRTKSITRWSWQDFSNFTRNLNMKICFIVRLLLLQPIMHPKKLVVVKRSTKILWLPMECLGKRFYIFETFFQCFSLIFFCFLFIKLTDWYSVDRFLTTSTSMSRSFCRMPAKQSKCICFWLND